MACEPYNIVKEGDLRNFFDAGITELDSGAINALYDEDFDSVVVTLSGTGVNKIALVAEFGEAYDICHINYYTDDAAAPPDFQVTYGTLSGTENTATFSNPSSGIFRGTINTFARFIEIRHTVSGTVAKIKQLEIIGIRNETLGFGPSKAEEQDYLFLDNSPVGTLSSTPNVVTLFNDDHHDVVAKVAVAPTFTVADDYIQIGTTASGSFFGIDDFGFLQPGPNPITLQDDSFLDVTLNPQWERIKTTSQGTSITPTSEGLIFEIGGHVGGVTSQQEVTGIISKEFFTIQSFTIEVEIRFLEFDVSAFFDRDWFMVITNSFPIPDAGEDKSHMSDARRGGSAAGIFMANRLLGFSHGFRWVDGNSDNNPSGGDITENRWTGGEGNGFFIPIGQGGETDQILGPDLDDIADIVNGGNSLGDSTSAAEWHTWRLTYDAAKGEIAGYVDNIFLGSRLFSVERFGEACKLAMGIHTRTNAKWAIRNFRVDTGRIYKQRNVALAINGGVASATVSGILDNVAKLIDGTSSAAYVGPEPTTLTQVRVDFDQPYDIVSYVLNQRDQSTGTSAFGKTYFPDIARNAIVDFGGKQTISQFYPNTDSGVRRSPTFSETATTVSGIQYLNLQFVDYDETSQPDGALVIEELSVIAAEYTNVIEPPPANEREFPWAEGRWNNLKHYGSSQFLALKDRIAVEAGFRPFPEYLVQGIDYQVSSAENGRQFSDEANEFHHSETLFSNPGATPAGDYVQWHSAPQSDHNFWIWRYFAERSRVKAVFWNSNTFRPSNVADKFKFQYLRLDGNPNDDNDWIDFPIIAKIHPFTGGDFDADTNYKDYKDYLIANNDGEFYTDYSSIPSFGTGFSFPLNSSLIGAPQGLDIIPTGYGIQEVVRFGVSEVSNGLNGFIEFDEAILTQGLRFVIHTPVVGVGPNLGLEANRFALESLQMYREGGTGSYISPVFDTGTPQNTERLKAVVHQNEDTSSAVFVRSSNTAPEQTYDLKYEIWEPFSTLGSEQVPITGFPRTHNRAVTREGKQIHLLGGPTYKTGPFQFDPVLDEWSPFDVYPAGDEIASGDTFGQDALGEAQGTTNTRPDILPDDRVRDNAAFLDDGHLYLACFNSTELRSPRLMRYQFTGDNIGWFLLDNQRPPFSEFANMVGFKDHLYFFNRDGTVSKYNVNTAIWIIVDALMPLHAGDFDRDDAATVLFEEKVYIFGGSVNFTTGLTNLDIFDLNTELFIIGNPAPFRLIEHQAVLVPEERVVYLLPVRDVAHPALKYDFDTGEYEVLEAMMWSRMAGGNTGITPSALAVGGWNVARYYYYDNGFIYGVRTNRAWIRARVSKEPWVHGKVPAIKDGVWGDKNATEDLSWIELSELGELMPQERYFQFKVELYSDDRVHTPILESVNVVTPQEVLVPASGTSDIFVKIGVSSDETYQAWYSGNRLEASFTTADDFSILYTESEEGLTWRAPTIASGTEISPIFSVRSPWVVKNSLTSYEFWYDRHAWLLESEIWYVTSTVPSNFSDNPNAQEVISKGVISQTEEGIYQPCVIKNSASDYEIFYTGEDSSNVKRIFYATSTDGISWGSHQLSLDIGNDTVNNRDANHVFRPMVLKENGTYRLWYTGTGTDDLDRILYTESTDGLTWDFPRLIIDINTEGFLDTRGASKPFVLLDEATYYIYYFGFDGVRNDYIIRGSSPDGIDFTGFTLAFPPGGLDEEFDSEGLEDFFAIINRDSVIPGELITTGRIKIHN